MWNPSQAEKDLLKLCASTNRDEAFDAQTQVCKALELPLRKGVQPGDIVGDIFERIPVENGVSSAEFPLHFMAPGDESEWVAFTMPSFGYIPQRHIQSDYVNVPIYYVGAAIDWDLRYAKNARWDVLSDAAENLRMQFVKKRNDDAWHTLMAAAYNRNIVVADSDAAQGEFSVRLVSLAKTVMARNGGGNSSSIDNSRLTDLYISIEAESDMRSWSVDQIDEVTRREIFTTSEGTLNRIFNVNIHALHELGEGQEYQNYMTSTLGGSLPTAGNLKLEWAFGLDKSKRRSFVNPVGEDIQVYPDDTKRRSMQAGMYGTAAWGWAVLDSRQIITLAL